MCGIAGLVDRQPGRPGVTAEMRAMLAALSHRGPDGEGIAHEGAAALGHRRLAIIDLSERASQPMRLRCADPDDARPIWTVLNGEIYNYRELRRDLAARGHRFHSDSDTETILHLYEEEGEAFPVRLRGMFALALWDGRSGRLLLARDRIGKKPLYYRESPGGFLFASEIKAIARAVRMRGETLEADPAALRSYLALKYVPGPQTAFRGVRRLPAGHTLILEEGRSRLARYWQLPPSARAVPADRDGSLRALASTLDEAIRLRMRSDVPLGLFLSGGLDSAIVAAGMARAAAGGAGEAEVRSFTVGFRERDYDETRRAARLAKALGTRHEEIRIDPTPAMVLDSLPRIAWHLDQPFADSSALAVWHLARLVRQRVTVALSGDGGDELFLGYDRYRAHRLAGRMPRGAAGALGRLARLLPGKASRRNVAGRAARFLDAAALPPRARNDAWIRLMEPSMAEGLLSGDFLAEAGPGDDLAALHEAGQPEEGSADPLDPIRRADLLVWLPDDVLHKVDSMTMAHGLEARAPLLDAEVVEAALRFPASSHLPERGGRGKRILREAVREWLPEGAGSGPKAGFGVPLDHWLRGGLSGWCRELLLSRRTLDRGIVTRAGVERLLGEHLEGRANREEALWSLVMLEQWFRSLVEARHEVAA